ncbi:hypothetical protein GCM10007890_22160 [Methylobacterium tardum]|uniref:Uncharacterized protein n=1 Tax=Methylobacterium tardum TaxID=374432 RepID=A0AA37TLE2_9HYPH|nr:hypothetical protein GCM10007890_22160 [Methylobacterium tardum]
MTLALTPAGSDLKRLRPRDTGSSIGGVRNRVREPPALREEAGSAPRSWTTLYGGAPSATRA